jgi:hypothetical protein
MGTVQTYSGKQTRVRRATRQQTAGRRKKGGPEWGGGNGRHITSKSRYKGGRARGFINRMVTVQGVDGQEEQQKS